MTPPQPAVGLLIERYELVCPIATGGMGAVWLARVKRPGGFERLFALKMVLPSLASNSKFRAMFLDEARMASAVRHPGIASIVDVGEHRGILFLAMEWVDGESLQALVVTAREKGEAIPLGVTLQIMMDVCEAMGAVHAATNGAGTPLDIVHRDISPHNILVDASGQATVIDFGIAKSADRTADNTEEGILKGKLRYMPPEQALGRPVDRRADIWALGAVLFVLLTLKPPFDDASDAVVAGRLLSGLEPPKLPETVPEQVRKVVERCLSVPRGERYSNAADIAKDLLEAATALRVRLGRQGVRAFFARQLRGRTESRRTKITNALRYLEAEPGAEHADVELVSPLSPDGLTLNASVLRASNRPSFHPLFRALKVGLVCAAVCLAVAGGAAMGKRGAVADAQTGARLPATVDKGGTRQADAGGSPEPPIQVSATTKAAVPPAASSGKSKLVPGLPTPTPPTKRQQFLPKPINTGIVVDDDRR